MVNIYENIIFISQSLFSHKFRNSLALLGVIIGIASIIIIGLVGKTGRKVIYQEIETFGLNTIWIFRDFSNEFQIQNQSKSGISLLNIEYIKDNASDIEYFAPVIQKKEWTTYHANRNLSKIIYTTPAFFSIENSKIKFGRLLSPIDNSNLNKVCVVGANLANKLFGESEALGRQIIIGQHQYEIVGVLKEINRALLSSIGIGGGEDPNDRIFIPIQVFQNQYKTSDVDYLMIKVHDNAEVQNVFNHINHKLQVINQSKYRYKYQAMADYLKSGDAILNTVSLILICATLISIIVGSIGITNVIMISVVERTKEIGIKRALGATSSRILFEFLSEATILTITAGVIGFVFSLIIYFSIKLFIYSGVIFPTSYVLLSFIICLISGISSGIYPAVRASKLNPSDALRYE